MFKIRKMDDTVICTHCGQPKNDHYFKYIDEVAHYIHPNEKITTEEEK